MFKGVLLRSRLPHDCSNVLKAKDSQQKGSRSDCRKDLSQIVIERSASVNVFIQRMNFVEEVDSLGR